MAPGSSSIVVNFVGNVAPLAAAVGKVKTLMGPMALAMGAAAAVGAGLSIKAFKDFDAAMTESIAIMGDVDDTMRNKLERTARDVAKTTSFSAVEAAESFYFLASAGLSVEQSIEALPKVAVFAQAGMFDMARATELLTSAQSALGLKTDDASQNMENMVRVSDTLVKANTLADASVEQFAEALGEKAAVTMRTFGIEVEAGVAALAVFAEQNIKGSRAGTIYTRTLEGLADNARNNSEAFAELGVEVFDADEQMRDLHLIVGEMEDAFDGMTVKQKGAALEAMGFNRQARAGILALKPFTHVRGSGFPSLVVVTAKWGWSEVPEDVIAATLIQASRLYRRKDSPEGVAGFTEMGGVTRVSVRMDPDVKMMLEPYRKQFPVLV